MHKVQCFYILLVDSANIKQSYLQHEVSLWGFFLNCPACPPAGQHHQRERLQPVHLWCKREGRPGAADQSHHLSSIQPPGLSGRRGTTPTVTPLPPAQFALGTGAKSSPSLCALRGKSARLERRAARHVSGAAPPKDSLSFFF